MQLRKIITAGTLATLMAGSSIAFAATLADLPQPFITSAGADDFLVVVGSKSTDATGLASDIVGAINIAARLGGETGASKTVGATTAGVSVSGEGKQLATSTTKVFLNNSMGKSGLRNTMTKDDLPTTLKSGILSDADAATTHNYQQFIYLTPSATSNPNYELEFKKPGSSSAADPTYNFGRFPTSPTDNDYLYRTYVTFDKDVNGTTAVGEKLELFGKTFTIHSDTTFIAGGTSNKLVLAGGSETVVMKGGETRTVTISGKTYDVTLDGVTSTPKASVTVKTGGASDSKDISQGSTTTVNGLSIFVDSATQLSTTDQTTNKAKLMLGAEKTVLQTGSKVKVGDTEDSVDGTYVNLTVSTGKLSALQVAVGGRSSNEDFLKAGGTYKDPAWKTFSLSLPSVSPDLTVSSRDVIKVSPSGDNLLQLQFTDANSNTKTINWGYKSASTGTAFSLADNSGNAIRVQENATVTKDEYFVVDAGDFTHFYKFTSNSVSSTPTASDYIEITDQFTGVTRKITVGFDSADPTVIDGQTYAFTANTTALIANWGGSAANKTFGTYQTIWPRLKGKNGEYLAFVTPTSGLNVIATSKLQLPTGAIAFAFDNRSVTTYLLNITATTNEDSSSSALATTPITVNLSAGAGTQANFTLGKTNTGGLIYGLTVVGVSALDAGVATINLTVPQISPAQSLQPQLLLVEEKDDSSNIYSVLVGASSEQSGSNWVAIPTTPTFTFSAATSGTGPGGVALGSDSTVTDYVDLYGVYARKTTTGQDTLTLYYPDDQVTANLAVVGVDGSATVTAGGTGTTVRESVPIKTAVARLDADVSAADRSNKNLILVGGPAVNSLVAELAAANKTKDVAWYRAQGAGTALLDLVEPGFGTGKVALVVAGYAAADTRAVASKVQDFGSQKDAFAGKKRVVWKNDVISTTAV